MVFHTLLSRSGQKHSVGWIWYFSDPKHSYPAGVTTEKENWAFWAKAWWAFTGMWEQRRTFCHMASTKAWHDCCSCVHHEGLLHLCHKRQGYCTTSLPALSQLNSLALMEAAWHLPCWETCGDAVPTHFLPAWDVKQFQMPSPSSSWHNPADWLWFLKLLQNWPQLMIAP